MVVPPSVEIVLQDMHCTNRRTLEYIGPACPYCGVGIDRFHIWLDDQNPRFWCRSCDSKGSLIALARTLNDTPQPAVCGRAWSPHRRDAGPLPRAEHIPHYRRLYQIVALWAYSWLREESNPDPLAYLHQRGLDDAIITRALLGYTLRDPLTLVDHLRQQCPDLLPYAEEAGVLVDWGELRTHPNLCGKLLIPYIANGEIVDLRTREYPPRTQTDRKYLSLPGGYTERGATFLLGWDDLHNTDTVLIDEGEFKILAANAAYHAGDLTIPALGHPGVNYFRPEWAQQLHERGIRTVILGYDTAPRSRTNGVDVLAGEERWTLRHGLVLQGAGLQVRVLRLPLDVGETKADLDGYLLRHSPRALQQLLDTAPLLNDYHASLPVPLLKRAKLPLPGAYPQHRPRPFQIAPSMPLPPPPAPTLLADARAAIPTLVQEHATSGSGFLVLAHPPGTGKGHGTTSGLRAYLTDAPDPGHIVWTALRKEQLTDQEGLDFIPLHGRNPNNCYKFREAHTLAAKGYSVRETLCQRRCPFLDQCPYLKQFGQEADFFAPQPLLQATGWWQQADAVVLDEFDPARLTRTVDLRPADLAAMARGTDCPHAHAVLRWLGQVIGGTLDHALSGVLLLAALDRAATAEQRSFSATLSAAIAVLPASDEQALLPLMPRGATLADYQALPPGWLPTILHQLVKEHRRRLIGQAFTSRLEAQRGTLHLYLLQDHLLRQLAKHEQPKIILDATVNVELLGALFPGTPVQLVQPRLALPNRVVQVVSRDWAKTSIQGERKERWYAAVAAHIRPECPTLVVCTMQCEGELRAALAARGLEQVVVAHYGALRGSNDYLGYDVVLAQVYHPNLPALVREGRALFADDAHLLDEHIITEDRSLTDAQGLTWIVPVSTFADPRLAALLEARREAELVQAALRGRPFDHPDVQITLLFGLPLAGLAPTIIQEGETSPSSNAGRQAAVLSALVAAGRRLLDGGQSTLTVQELAQTAGVSVSTVRTHWKELARQLKLRARQEHRITAMPRGGRRVYIRAVLVRRGRGVPAGFIRTSPLPPPVSEPPLLPAPMIDQARNEDLITRLIYRERSSVLVPRGKRQLLRRSMPRGKPWRLWRHQRPTSTTPPQLN